MSPQEDTNIRTRISMTYFNVYAWAMFIHVQICLLSDFITLGIKEVTQRNNLRRGHQERFRAFRPAQDI